MTDGLRRLTDALNGMAVKQMASNSGIKAVISIGTVVTTSPVTIRPMGSSVAFGDADVLWTNTSIALQDEVSEGDTVLLASVEDTYIVIDVMDVGIILGGGGSPLVGDGAITSDYLIVNTNTAVDVDTTGLVVVDSSSGTVDITLPSTPTDGAKLEVVWYTGANQVTIKGNGKTILGSPDFPIPFQKDAFKLTYCAGTVAEWVVT